MTDRTDPLYGISPLTMRQIAKQTTADAVTCWYTNWDGRIVRSRRERIVTEHGVRFGRVSYTVVSEASIPAHAYTLQLAEAV